MSSAPKIPNEHHVARYCKPSTVEREIVMASAFQPKPDEEYLSVNWLEYFGVQDVERAVQCVRLAFGQKGYMVRKNGRFAVLGVDEVLRVIHQAFHRSLAIEHRPTSDDPSHAGISGYGMEDIEIATELCLLLDNDDVYPAVP